jgi:hypothetical protein
MSIIETKTRRKMRSKHLFIIVSDGRNEISKSRDEDGDKK